MRMDMSREDMSNVASNLIRIVVLKMSMQTV